MSRRIEQTVSAITPAGYAGGSVAQPIPIMPSAGGAAKAGGGLLGAIAKGAGGAAGAEAAKGGGGGAFGQIAEGLTGMVGGLIGGGKRRREQREANRELKQRKQDYEQFEFKDNTRGFAPSLFASKA